MLKTSLKAFRKLTQVINLIQVRRKSALVLQIFAEQALEIRVEKTARTYRSRCDAAMNEFAEPDLVASARSRCNSRDTKIGIVNKRREAR